MIRTIGVIGLGAMGGGIARNIIRKGPEKVILYAATSQIRERFKSEGFCVADSYAEFAAADLIFLCVPDAAAVEEILFGDGRLAPYLRRGQIIVDLSTISCKAALGIKTRLDALGIVFLDSPVSGMAARAESGELTVMVGGDKAAFEAVRPIMERFGSSIQYMGKSGNGQLMKLINQLLFDINLAGMAEIMPLAAKMGLDPEKVASIINTGAGRSFATEQFLPKILKGVFTGGYTMAKAYKDIISAEDISASDHLYLPVLAAAAGTYKTALLKGYGDCDKGAMIRCFEELFGVEFRAGAQKQ